MRIEFLDNTLQLHHYLISSISVFPSHTNTKITSKHSTIQASSSLSFFLSILDLNLSSLVISICKSSIAALLFLQWRLPSKNPLFPSSWFRSQNQSNRRPRIQKHQKLPSQRKPRSLKPESLPVLESPLLTLLTKRYYYYYY